ncbi:flagellar export chaperone FliS [Thermodesulfatator autotrophicus]|uniref:Flagellar secretion chaperone FliS n=1 Tax=Thermodesulfatator autotrophicus TaxID=1795632 RepID=A0A177EC51_9BACT|nr:flagellar export chaperone FliS [Thermodesulfatator autotrophicus]OAG28579.1 hypothetical protein TH606_01075 [Thermodesulfatator autotrophicus]
MTGYAQAAISAYKRIEVNTYSDKRLILLKLFEGLMDSIKKAARAILSQNYEEKGKNIARAVAILGELCAALDREQEAEWLTNLEALYFYAMQELTLANLENDLSHLKNAERALTPIYEAWQEAVKISRQQERETAGEK